MGRMAEKWEETRLEREMQADEDFDWQRAQREDPDHDKWLKKFEQEHDRGHEQSDV